MYTDMVDQTQLGHRFIQSEFGSEALPSVTWQVNAYFTCLAAVPRHSFTHFHGPQCSILLFKLIIGHHRLRAPNHPIYLQIDPFGHSGAQASLFSSPAAGFEAL